MSLPDVIPPILIVGGSSKKRTPITESVSNPTEPRRNPNVLLIQIDDVGVEMLESYDDLVPAAWGSSSYATTPNIDALAARGLRFRRNYATPICSPTKATSITGRQPVASEINHLLGVHSPGVRLSKTQPTIGQAEKLVGSTYRSLQLGKWHLCAGEADLEAVDETMLQVCGFDRYKGATSNLNVDNNTGFGKGATLDGAPAAGNWWEYDSATGMLTNQGAAHYVTEREKDLAIDWASGDEPWLIHWWMHSAHSPFHWPPPAMLAGAPADPGIQIFTYFKAMIEAADTMIGEAIAGCGDPELEHTVVIFISDNGTQAINLDASNVNHNGFPPPDVFDPDHCKDTAYEQGTLVPMIIAGPGIPRGKTCDALVTCADLAPTIKDLTATEWSAAEGDLETDGVSLVPLFSSPDAEVRELAYTTIWQPLGSAITDANVTDLQLACWDATGDYKLILTMVDVATGIVEEFYKLGSDPADRYVYDGLEEHPLDPDDGPDRQAAYTRLRDYVILKTGLSWPSSIST